uniref:Uncharacterized protein n=1 Tax=Panagrolaimus davidi TaxID=227884 RepID=A0A914P5U8_9BILA
MSMFSNEFFDKLDPSYRILLQKLVEKLEVENEDYDAEDNEKFIKDFLKNYMLPIELWTELFEEYSCDDNPAFAYYQFYFPDVAAIELELDNSHKLMNLKAVFEDRRWEQLPRLIEFPNYEMDNCFMEYEETVRTFLPVVDSTKNEKNILDKPIPKKSLKKYEKMRKIYDKIMSERDNSEALFFALTETDDVEFVKHNVEYRLGSDLTDKVLWKLYINYLEKFDVQLSKNEKEEIREESIYAEIKDSLENRKFKNIRLTTVFSFETDSKNTKYSDSLLSKIISRISQCTAKYVSLKSKQTITFNELKFFIGHGNIFKLEMDGIKCLSENGKDVVIEEILMLTPKIMHFEQVFRFEKIYKTF